MLRMIPIVILTLALLAVLPRWKHSREWGYFPTVGVGVILLALIILLALRWI
jgi:hypothetical protein